jgi:hypothetical protein
MRISSATVTPPFDGLDHALADHGLQRSHQLTADLLALLRLEEVQDAGDRLRGGGGVQGGKDECPVSAAPIAAWKLIASRISPIMMMSGSWRRTYFSPWG